MKIIRITLGLLLFQLGLLIAEEKPLYPGNTYYVTPSFSSSGLIGIEGDQFGEGLSMGLEWAERTKGTYFGVQGGYAFLIDENDTLSLPWLELRGGLIFRPASIFRLNAYCGVGCLSDTYTMTLGGSADFRLLERNYIYLDSSVTMAPDLDTYGHYSFGLGIKRSIPVLHPVPPVNLAPTLSSMRFSPDGDGVEDILTIYLNMDNPRSCKNWKAEITDHMGNPVISWKGEGTPPKQINWDGYSSEGAMVFSGADYTLSVSTIDRLGNGEESEAPFVTDVFVEESAGGMRIRIPGIIFSAGTSDFDELSEEELHKNEKIISRLKEILDKFPEYKISIEGYGNLLNWESEEEAKREQEEILIPLSRSRAARIKDYLVEKGIEEERLEVVGRGGESPLVPFGDVANRWKNRRVEFILLK
jgi:outer membrane protein OmpA-like peptidoglycan-associated protein